MSGLSARRTAFGVHSVTLYDRLTKLPYGIFKVVGEFSTNMKGDFKDLFGGSSPFAWDSESGTLDASLSMTIKEIPDFAFEKFLGATVTTQSAEASGNVGSLTNVKGSSCMSATIGIATATLKSGQAANLKDAIYVVKVTAATKVDVYALQDTDFDVGTDLAFVDDTMKITATELTIAQGAAVEIPNTGIELTGGSGTIGMTVGDTATIHSRKINAGSSIIAVGASTATFPAFGVIAMGQKKGNGETFEIDMFNCKGIGLPLSLKEKDWLNAQVTLKAMYDATAQKVFQIRSIKQA